MQIERTGEKNRMLKNGKKEDAAEKKLEKLPLKKLERSMPSQEEEEKAEKEKSSSARKGKF